MKRPCIFFDRDGIVNESPGPGYVQRWEDFYLQPGFVAALRVAKEKGYPAVVITNQQGVAKGLYSEEKLQDIHQRFRVLLRAHRLDVLDIYYCPHLDADGCECRKPKPGMLIEASKKHGLDLSKSWMVGDSENDVEAGHNAGCRALRVMTDSSEKTAAEFCVEHIDEVAGILEKELAPCG
ncbi:MAG: HAD family hydrolase [Kiritimatiellales bacterium]|nr:HAD family hydrolase [Kiritimatiellales bacterium]